MVRSSALSLLFLMLSPFVCLSLPMPSEVKLPQKGAPATSLKLLGPLDNLVEPDPPATAADTLPPPPVDNIDDNGDSDADASAPVPTAPSVTNFRDRAGFITGHRIPIELFGDETRARLEEEDQTESNKAYVDASAFRRGQVKENTTPEVSIVPPTKEAPFPTPSDHMQPPLPSHRLPSVDPLRPPPPSPHELSVSSSFLLDGGVMDPGLHHEKDPAYFGHLDAFVTPDFLQ